MIVAIASFHDQSLKSLLATNLAVLRARSGRKICVIDTTPRQSAYSWSCDRNTAGQWPAVSGRALAGRTVSREIEKLGPGFGDLLISTGEYDEQETLSALIAARLVIVPVRTDQVNVDVHYPMIARLNSARMFNPALKVMFVIVTDGASPSPEELAAVRLYVSHVMSATLADTVLHAPFAHDYGQGRCVCDAETCDPDMAAEIHSLYREVSIHQANYP
jgi:chromosome partitioning protein